jgi:nucleotide-binding universal stress UspA family protein
MFKKILAPIDGSKPSSNALLKALELAKTHGSEVEILHVMTFTEDAPKDPENAANIDSPPEWIDSYVSRVKKNDENMLKDAVIHSKTIAPNNKITSKLLIGKPGDEITHEAEQGGFDLIVIGSRGLGGLKELVLGSVSHQVVNESKIPVLVVK